MEAPDNDGSIPDHTIYTSVYRKPTYAKHYLE